MKFCILNDGVCTRLKIFGEEIRDLLKQNNWKEDKSNPEIIFINTCSFIKSKEKEYLKKIKSINSVLKPPQKICVFGCLPSTNKKEIKKINKNIILFKRDLLEIISFFKLKQKKIFPPHTIKKRLNLLAKLIIFFNCFLKEPSITYRLKKSKVFHLRISVGCLGNCTYCSERFTTKLKSLPEKEIISEFKKGLKKGFKIFSFNSDDTSAFGKDNNENIYSLLEKILKIKKDFSLVITEFNPQGLLDKRILKLLKSKKIVFITIPIQSASKKILDKMQRPYNISKIVKRIKEIKRLNHKIKINTHFIIGFPGETRKDFQDSLDLIDKGLFDRIKIFKYNDRQKTIASKMKNKISENEKQERFIKMRKKVLLTCIKKKSFSNLLLNLKTLI